MKKKETDRQELVAFFVDGRWIDCKSPIERRRRDRRTYDRRTSGERRHPDGVNDRRRK